MEKILALALVVALVSLAVVVGETVAPSDEPRMEFENGNVSFSGDGEVRTFRISEEGSFESVDVEPSEEAINVEVREYARGNEVVSGDDLAEYELEFESEYRLETDESNGVTVRRIPTEAEVVNATESVNVSVVDEVEAGEEVEMEVEVDETETENEDLFVFETDPTQNRSDQDEDG